MTLLKKNKRIHIQKFTNNDLFNIYKYYFPKLSENVLKKNIAGCKKITEQYVFNLRNPQRTVYSLDERIFIDYLSGMCYPQLIDKYKCSRRSIANAIRETRRKLIEGIKKDISNGVLTL